MAPLTETKLSQLETDLVAPSHLTRSKAFLTLKTLIPFETSEDQIPLLSSLDSFVLQNLHSSSPWEPQHGAFGAAAILYPFRGPAFKTAVFQAALQYLDSPELRVRLSIVECFLEFSKGEEGVDNFRVAKDTLYSSIVDNFERKRHHHDHHHHHEGDKAHHKETPPHKTEKKTDLVHDTEGFRCLETSMKILLNVLLGTGARFAPVVDDALLDILQRSIHHTNRYVRETAFFICRELFSVAASETLQDLIAPRLGPELAVGLDDNWSEVRFAACGALRVFLTKGAAFRTEYYETLIPRMLLNRYYAAQGVKVFSLETWNLVIGEQGRTLVAEHIDRIVEYYISQIDSDNFGVREASIHCMGELATRIPPAVVRPYVDSMMQALSGGFGDTSWPVRAAACQVCGHFMLAYPEESKDMIAAELYQLCLEHIPDEIWSVREASAISIINLIRAYGEEVQDKILDKIRELLPMASQHVATNAFHNATTKFSLEEKKKRDNDPNLHTGQVLFACCTLAPRTKKKIGHNDHGYNRQAEPWEYSDGSIYLVRELAEVNPNLAKDFIPAILQVASLPAFPHYQTLLETIWKQMPALVKLLGTELVAPFLSDIIVAAVLSLSCENRLAMNAAGIAIDDLREQFGEEAFEQRCTEEQLAVMKASPYVHSFRKPTLFEF